MQDGRTTLSKFLIDTLDRQPSAVGSAQTAGLSALLIDVAAAIKAISAMLTKGSLGGHYGSAQTVNTHGEEQKKLDVATNEIFVQQCEWDGLLAAMVSEEMEEVYAIPPDYPRGDYLLAFDPLDGSSNIDINGVVGSIFSVLRTSGDGEDAAGEAAFLRPGYEQVAAGYAVYGPSTMLVLSVGNGTHGFTLERDIGNFVLTHSNIRIPEDTVEFAINASNERFWEPPVRRYVAGVQGRTQRLPRARLQHALDRVDGRGSAPHPDARRRVHVSARLARRQPWKGACVCCTRRIR